MSHFPSHIGKHFRNELAASPLEGSLLFGDQVLVKVSGESLVDSTLNAQLTIAKAAVSLPVFGAGKGDRKASSDSSSSAAPSAPPQRGRGRGFLFRGLRQKRAAGGKDHNPKAPKSPRKGEKAPRGRGFPK